MAFEVRVGRTGDAGRLPSLHTHSLEELATDHYDDAQLAALKDGIEPGLYPVEDGDCYFVVAENGDDLVGFGWLEETPGEYLAADVAGELAGLYVHPDVAGGGVGSAMYRDIEGYARTCGIDSLAVWASLNAIPFYRTLGFTEVTRHELAYETATVPVVEMRKEIS